MKVTKYCFLASNAALVAAMNLQPQVIFWLTNILTIFLTSTKQYGFHNLFAHNFIIAFFNDKAGKQSMWQRLTSGKTAAELNREANERNRTILYNIIDTEHSKHGIFDQCFLSTVFVFCGRRPRVYRGQVNWEISGVIRREIPWIPCWKWRIYHRFARLEKWEGANAFARCGRTESFGGFGSAACDARFFPYWQRFRRSRFWFIQNLKQFFLCDMHCLFESNLLFVLLIVQKTSMDLVPEEHKAVKTYLEKYLKNPNFEKDREDAITNLYRSGLFLFCSAWAYAHPDSFFYLLGSAFSMYIFIGFLRTLPALPGPKLGRRPF